MCVYVQVDFPTVAFTHEQTALLRRALPVPYTPTPNPYTLFRAPLQSPFGTLVPKP